MDVCVTELPRGWYFPKKIPRPRGRKNVLIQTLLGLTFFSISLWYLENITCSQFFWTFFTLYILLNCLVEFLQRSCHFFEEIKHVPSRYNNNFLKLIKTVFQCSMSICILTIISIFAVFIIKNSTNKYPWTLFHESGPISNIFALVSCLLLRQLLVIAGLEDTPLYHSLWMDRAKGLNYGAGMASSFYHGYLKLVLPKTGSEETDLNQEINIYQSREDVVFGEYKLFILIPQSTYCPTSLKNEYSPSVVECSSLGEKIKTVAGVQNRVYKNSVYRILSGSKKPVYVCAEYATPLKTFNEVMKSHGQFSKFYEQQKNEIVLQFYTTLKKILEESPDSRKLCELIYFDDVDANGDRYDVGRIILKRVAQLQKKKTIKSE